MWKTSLILLLLSFAVNSKTTKKRVCIVGAGISGLVAVKYLSEYPDEFEPIVFEKNSDVGGLWIYTDSTTVDEHGLPVHSSIYKSLRTNGVKEAMIFPDYPHFGDESTNGRFIKHELVLSYLKNYTEHFNLRQYIHFNSNVEKIEPLSHLRWLTVWRDLNNNKMTKTTCDAVMVCSGHNFKGYEPKIPGIESFTGQVLHSHVYRKPAPFAKQTVVVLGVGDSALDISVEISSVAEKVYLSHRRAKVAGTFPSNLEQVPAVVRAEDDKLVFSNGTKIHVDTLILATGYIFDYPFLANESGIAVVENGKQIHWLYKYLINVERPTMAFIDLPSGALHFHLVHAQVNYFRTVLRGKLSLPSREQMMVLAQMQLTKETPGKGPISNFNNFWKYYEDFVDAANGEPLPWWIRPYINEKTKIASRDPIYIKGKRLIIHENNRTVEFV